MNLINEKTNEQTNKQTTAKKRTNGRTNERTNERTFAMTPSSAFALTPSSAFALTPSWVVRKTWFSAGFSAVRMDLPKTFLKVFVDPEYIKFSVFIKLILHGGV